MTFPSGTTISTANLDSADDDPSLARADLYNMAVAVNSIIASENTASGVLVLDGSAQVPSANMPATLNPASTQTISPGNKIVNIRDVLRMQQRYVGDNALLTSPTAGDIIYLVDGDGVDPCLGVYDGSNWRVIRFAMRVGDVPAALTATATLTATAVP
jgi:hypothetical protein